MNEYFKDATEADNSPWPPEISEAISHVLKTQRYIAQRPRYADLSDWEFVKVMVTAASTNANYLKRELEDQFCDIWKSAAAAKKLVLTGEALAGLLEYASLCPDLDVKSKTSKLLKDVLAAIGKKQRDRATQHKNLPKRKKEDKKPVSPLRTVDGDMLLT